MRLWNEELKKKDGCPILDLLMRKENGKTIYQKGQLEHVKAIGWYIEDFKRAQVSINLTNYKETSLASVFETTKAIAKNYGLEVTGSELIGLIPKQALLEAGKYYVKNASADEESQLNAAIKFLGLDELKPFDYKKRVLEYVIDKKHWSQNDIKKPQQANHFK